MMSTRICIKDLSILWQMFLQLSWHFFIVTINTMVLLLMAKKKHLRSITNLLLCSLAVSDLLTGLVAVPMFLMCNHHIQSATCITEEMTARFISALIVCHLMAVTTDR